MTTCIKITGRMGYRWVWQLVTHDGHVADESWLFDARSECEADALKQGLPVIGLSRAARSSPAAERLKDKPWRILQDPSSRLWHWKRFDDEGNPVEASERQFLTKRECVADAVANGYTDLPKRMAK